jgi:hypothetical protein
MNGELAQIITLVAHGNLFLHGGETEKIDFSGNSTFQYVSSIKFARYRSNQDKEGVVIANSVSDWFDFLRSIKVTRLWNIAFGWQRQDILEHVADAFASGVPRAIQADSPNGFELWYPKWKTGGQKQKPWLIEYRSLMFPNSQAIPAQTLSTIKEHLRHATLGAKNFSERSDINASNWATWFAKSLDLLDSPDPKSPFYPDLLPDMGFSLEAHQILASAEQAYVFGGMGSWNEMGFEQFKTQKEYKKVTEELYEAIKLAIIMASNSFLLKK